ncbi:MAG: putative LPS assembly protein LptD, partial [Gemmatimonadota bacterium]
MSRGLLALALAVSLAVPVDATAQVPRDTLPPDTAAADSLRTARDSAQARVRQRLQALARPPGTAPDTLPEPGVGPQGARGRTGSGVGLPPTDSVMTALAALEGYRATRYSSVAARYNAPEEQLVLYGGAGMPRDETAEPDTLTTEEADSVLVIAAALRGRADSLGTLLTDTTQAVTADREVLVARMDSLQSVADSLTRRAAPGEGEPEVKRATLTGSEGYRLEGEEYILYNQRTETAQARGDPTFTPPDGSDPVEADSLNIDVTGERASAFEARTHYAQGGGTDWNVVGDLPYVGQQLVYGSHTSFTSCDLEQPHYHFQTESLKIVQGSVLVARPVKLYFADVPVAWLPFVAQSLARGRASGLLTPRFSVNDIVRTSGGYRRRISNIGFYWAMSDYSDATVALDWFDQNYTSLTGSLRFRWLRQFLGGTLNYRQYWRDNGGQERSLDSQAQWELSERTSFRSSIRWASSRDFVRRNSFDPREVTAQITSSGGLSHRFDWGSLNVTGNRTESLSNDEVNMTLPDVSLSLNTLTLFRAPAGRAAWYNNISLGGSAKFRQSSVDRAPDTLGFRFASADTRDRSVSANTSLSLGNLSLGQSFSYSEGSTMDVPTDSLVFFPDQLAARGMGAFDSRLGQAFLDDLVDRRQEEGEGGQVDISQARVSWNTSLGYQQTLIGSTTLTPSLTLSGEALRSDTMEVAQSFVSGPTRISFGADLKADIYGFYPGFAGYQAIRHKLTPTIRYDWAPEVQPSELQERVFGSQVINPRSVLTLGLNQTWEAKRVAEEDSTAGGTGGPGGLEGEPPGPGGPGGAPADSAGPRRQEQAEIVNLLSIRTSATTYDFVADSLGYLFGFQRTTLDNQISSDFLPGLTISMSHDLFDDTTEGTEGGEGEGPPTPSRKFDPHLRSMNFGFSLSSRSAIVGLLGLGGGDEADEEPSEAEEQEPTSNEPFSAGTATDESSIIPGQGSDLDRRGRRSGVGGGGTGWSANFRYSLNRPRAGGAQKNQTLGINLRLNPTSQWEMSWDTSYDIEEGTFQDHTVRLTRDLHRWQANFGFQKAANGNWRFRFEV